MNDQNLFPSVQENSAVALKETITVDASRAAKEVEGAIIIAKKFPRDQNKAFDKIISSCKRKGLAETAIYRYPRGGQTISGPSIRLAEVLAREWGNMQYGIREISRTENESIVQCFCWDLESNVRVTREFTQPHTRYSKEKGNHKLTDPRDIYETVANMGSRRVRACILEIIPGDVTEEAMRQCNKTIKGDSKEPIGDRIRKLVAGFSNLNISQEEVERRLEHPIKEMSIDELSEYIGILRSILDGMSKKEDWFKTSAAESGNAGDLNKMLDEKKAEKSEIKKEEPKPKEDENKKKVKLLNLSKKMSPAHEIIYKKLLDMISTAKLDELKSIGTTIIQSDFPKDNKEELEEYLDIRLKELKG